MRQLAEKYCPQLLKNAVRYAMEAPREIKEMVYRDYADKKADGSYVFDGDALLDEIFAHRFAREHGDLFRQMLNEKPKVKHWWANITNAVRSVFQDAAKRNGVDLEGLRGLGADEYIAKVAEQLAAGKELNEWTAYGKDKEFFGKGIAVGDGGNDEMYARRSGTVEQRVPRAEHRAFWEAFDKVVADYKHSNEDKTPLANGLFTGEAYYLFDIIDGTPINIHRRSINERNRDIITNFDKTYKSEIYRGASHASTSLDALLAVSSRDSRHIAPDEDGRSRNGYGDLVGRRVSQKREEVANASGNNGEVPRGEEDESIRYSRVTDKSRIGDFEKARREGRTIKTMRSFVVVDGKLYSPMASQEKGTDGKWRLGEPVGELKDGKLVGYLQKADERPDLAIWDEDSKSYKFKLKKEGKAVGEDGKPLIGKNGKQVKQSDITALYNPYWHSSNSALNDQFTSAYKRPNIVTVECEILKDEAVDGRRLDGGVRPDTDLYWADKANASIGRHDWHTGTVAKDLPEGEKRSVYLTRELLPVRIMSTAETADKIISQLGGNLNKSGEYNAQVFPPQLARALEVRGMKLRHGVDDDGIRYSRRDRDAATPYDERTEDGRKFNEKYGSARIGDAHVSQRAVDALGDGGRELDAALAARRADAGEAKGGVLRYSRGDIGSVADVDENIRKHEKVRFGDGETRKHGMESFAVVRDGDSVYKYRTAKTGLENERTNLARHNELFGDKTPYEIADFASGDGGDVLVVKQSYIDLMPKSGNIARKQLEADLRKRFGSVEVMNGGNEMRAGGWVIDDLKDGNIGIDRKTGRYAVVDALIHRVDEIGSEDGAAKPKGLVVDAGMGETPGDGEDGIRYSRSRHPAPTPASSALMEDPDTSAMTVKERAKFVKDRAKKAYMRNFADRYYDVKDVVRDAMVASGMSKEAAEDFVMNSPLSPYHSKRVQGGMAEKNLVRVRAIENDMAEDIRKSLAPLGLDIDDLGTWGYVSHAEARNAQKLKDHGVTDGSGISDADAQNILKGGTFTVGGKSKRYTAAQRTALEDARKKVVHRLNKEFGLDYLHKAGLIDEASMRRLETAYGENWVSLMDDIGEDGVDYGASTSVANPLKKAHGRTTALEDNPIVSTLVGAMSNVVNANKNMAAETFARFVEQHPEMGEVRTMTPMDKMDSSRIVFRRNVTDPNTGEEKNVKMLITLYGRRGAEVAKSFTDANLVRGPQAVQNFTRQWASFATQLSPTFSLRNFMKDTVEVTMDTLGTQGVGAAGRFLRGQIAMMPLWNREFRSILREWRKTGQVTGTSQLAQDFKKFVESGALIGGLGREGYGDVHGNLADVTDIRNLSDIKKLSDLRNEKHVKALSKAWSWYTDKVGAMNESIEMLTRFNNFRNRLAAGESVGEAAINSREGSTDFGMYGNQRWMNSVWMFSNSILGGTMRAAKTLTGGKYSRRLAVGMIALGFLEEMANAALNDDDENAKNGDPTEKDVNEYTRENSLRLRIGGKMVKIPAHFGPFSVLKYAGNNAYRALTGQITAEEAAKNVGAAAFKVGSHLTGTGEHGIAKDDPSLIASLMPTAGVQPLVQAALNEDYKGDPIAKEHSLGTAKYAPDWKYARSNTGKGWIALYSPMYAETSEISWSR